MQEVRKGGPFLRLDVASYSFYRESNKWPRLYSFSISHRVLLEVSTIAIASTAALSLTLRTFHPSFSSLSPSLSLPHSRSIFIGLVKDLLDVYRGCFDLTCWILRVSSIRYNVTRRKKLKSMEKKVEKEKKKRGRKTKLQRVSINFVHSKDTSDE